MKKKCPASVGHLVPAGEEIISDKVFHSTVVGAPGVQTQRTVSDLIFHAGAVNSLCMMLETTPSLRDTFISPNTS